MQPPTDRELVTAARAGDRDAFGLLVERHQAALLRTCRRALGDPTAAPEVAQEAVLHALMGLASLRDDGAFGPWLCGIGQNLARRARRTPAPLPLETLPEPAAPGPEERGEGAQVRAAIAALPRGQREAVALFYLADLSHIQISERLGISVGAVKTRLHKARASLQTRLADLRRELPAMPSTVPMHVADIREAGDEALASHVVFLEEEGGPRRLPIWIGKPEAMTLAVRLHAVDLPRPDTYRFAADLLAVAGAALREIGEELAAALASPRDSRAIAEELKARMTYRGRGA